MAAQGQGATQSAPAAGSASNRPKSKAYLSSVAIQSDATKYRQKYKELKRKVREIESACAASTFSADDQENDKLQAMTLRIKRNIRRLRLERSCVPAARRH